MKNKISFYIGFVVLLLLVFQSESWGQALNIKNVRFEEKDEAVVVKYDLDGVVGEKYKVTLSLSDNFGESFKIRPKNTQGDVGKNVKPGAGKEIIWNLYKDFPNGLSGEGFVFAVDAELQGGKSKLPYYLAGAGVVGGVIILAVSIGGKEKPNPTTGSIRISVSNNY